MPNCEVSIKVLRPDFTPAEGISVFVDKCFVNHIDQSQYDLEVVSDSNGKVLFTVPQGSTLLMSCSNSKSLNGQIVAVPLDTKYNAGNHFADTAIERDVDNTTPKDLSAIDTGFLDSNSLLYYWDTTHSAPAAITFADLVTAITAAQNP